MSKQMKTEFTIVEGSMTPEIVEIIGIFWGMKEEQIQERIANMTEAEVFAMKHVFTDAGWKPAGERNG